MGKYVVRRLLQMIPVVIGATFILFALVFALPGDPTAGRCGERPCPPSYVAAFRAEYHLDDPLLTQYGIYLGKLVHGDLGTNFYGNSVTADLSVRYPVTIKLALIAILVEIIIGIGAGVHCSGQVLVLHDVLGTYLGRKAKFVKNFMDGQTSIDAAIRAYVSEVKAGSFPAPEHSFSA